MSFDDSDLQDIFRRAFEDRERRGENGEQPPRRPGGNGLPNGWWRNRRVWLIGALLLLFISFNWIVTTYTDWLWFQNVNYTGVWTTTFIARIVTFLIFFVVAFLILYGNIRYALKGAMATSTGFQPAQYSGFRLVLNLVAAFIAFTFGSAAAASWEMWLQYINRAPSTITDPIFNNSLTFYFFELPVYQFLQGWFIPLLFLAGLGVTGIYAAHNIEALRQREWQPQNLEPLRRHLAVIAAALALLFAVGSLLGRYTLLYQHRASDLVAGAGYTDINITARALLLNATLLVILAVVLAYNAVKFNPRPVIAVAVLWFASIFILNGIVPSVFERFVVAPNQLGRERPYLQHNIDYTRQAFGLDKVDERSFGDVTNLSADDLSSNEAALKNIRLWDYRVLPENYEQLQELRPYYQFSDVDIDRYEINGEIRQVMLAARELEKDKLTNRQWENLRLEFTHGYGIVMNPVDRFTRDGQPEFYIGDLPPKSTVDIELTRPEIYYGDTIDSDDIVYVGTDREFDYPSGDETVRTSYAGEGGVRFGNYLNKLAFSFRFADINVLINNDITNDTRVMYKRNVRERILEITPFLALDNDPYLIVADGRLVWMVDAYTYSDSFPYSETAPITLAAAPQGINYIRNTAKITVDAYDGTVIYYQVDTEDPIVQTYASAYPNLFKPLSDMPESLRAHVRYPETLFRIQAEQYLKYHMTDVGVFYREDDLWAIPQEEFRNSESQDIEPYYVIFNLPDEEETEYLLIQPVTPNDKPNMVGWLAARNDGEHYGELVSYILPKQEVVLGPIQIEAKIGQDSEISPQISLWNEGGSEVIRGNLIVIPLNQSFLYVEPLYLKSAGDGSRPELKRVIVASGDNVAMEETLAEALAELINIPSLDIGDTTVDVDSEALPLPDDVDGVIQALIQSANEHWESAESALQAGDWTAYGEAQELLERDLLRLLEISEGAAP